MVPRGVPENRATLRKGACSGLLSYIEGEKTHPTEREVTGVGVLTHIHAQAGHTDEAQAEYASVQRIGQTAVFLGASEAEALDLAHSYLRIWYPRLLSRYTIRTASPGGFDEHIPCRRGSGSHRRARHCNRWGPLGSSCMRPAHGAASLGDAHMPALEGLDPDDGRLDQSV